MSDGVGYVRELSRVQCLRWNGRRVGVAAVFEKGEDTHSGTLFSCEEDVQEGCDAEGAGGPDKTLNNGLEGNPDTWEIAETLEALVVVRVLGVFSEGGFPGAAGT